MIETERQGTIAIDNREMIPASQRLSVRIYFEGRSKCIDVHGAASVDEARWAAEDSMEMDSDDWEAL